VETAPLTEGVAAIVHELDTPQAPPERFFGPPAPETAPTARP
jgi:hypothetical protein